MLCTNLDSILLLYAWSSQFTLNCLCHISLLMSLLLFILFPTYTRISFLAVNCRQFVTLSSLSWPCFIVCLFPGIPFLCLSSDPHIFLVCSHVLSHYTDSLSYGIICSLFVPVPLYSVKTLFMCFCSTKEYGDQPVFLHNSLLYHLKLTWCVSWTPNFFYWLNWSWKLLWMLYFLSEFYDSL